MKKYPKYKNTNIEWLDQIPEDWLDTKLKYVVKIKSGEGIKSEEILPTGLFPVFGGNGIVGYTNDFNNEEEVLVIGRVGAKCGNVRLVSEKKWISDNALYAKTNIHKVFLLYKLESINLNNLANKNAQPLITSTMINEQVIPLPPLPEQKAIAEYLDKKTSEIDQIIDAKKKLIALYNEEKSALINRAVTKGIDDKVKLKPSGVEWLGDIPQHWEVKKLKYIGDSIMGLTYSPDDVVDRSNDSILVLRSSNIQKGKLALKDTVYLKKVIPDKLLLVRGDILICSRNGSRRLIGKNIQIDREMEGQTFGAFMTIFRTKYSNFISLFFNSNLFISQSSLFLTTTINQLTINTLNNFYIGLPPLKEQEKIVEYIEKNVSVIDKKVANAKRLIELMTEYRTTLISEVVTGKVKVV